MTMREKRNYFLSPMPPQISRDVALVLDFEVALAGERFDVVGELMLERVLELFL
ncbi:MAG: hypothetical protein HN948_09335 [Clostridia bacterium]|nr:hypothetical protein [Clostridia bacterium]